MDKQISPQLLFLLSALGAEVRELIDRSTTETHLRGHAKGMVVEGHPRDRHRIGADRPSYRTRSIGHLEALRRCLWALVSVVPWPRRSSPHSRKVLLDPVPRVRWFPHSAAVQLLHCVSSGERTRECTLQGQESCKTNVTYEDGTQKSPDPLSMRIRKS